MLRSALTLIALLTFAGSVPQVMAQESDKPAAASTEEKSEASAEKKSGDEEVAVIQSTMGTIVFRFYEEDAPKTTANFKKLANEKFYDGTTFHRVIPGFVIQGGDPNSKDKDKSNDGQGGPGYTVPAEINHKHKRGAVATARLPDSVNPKQESSGSQFYIAVKALPQLDGNYTVFAEVIDGMDVVDKIVAVQRDGRDNPLEPVVMTTVRIEKLSAYEKGKSKEKSAKKEGKS